MRPITLTCSPTTASATRVAASASPGAGAIVLAATATALDANGLGRIVSLVSGSDDSGITFTITGKDANGKAITEAVTGGNSATVVSTKFYASVSSITHTGSVAGTFSAGIVGTTLSAQSKLIPLNFYTRTPTEVAIEVTGTINFTVKETFDNILAATANVNPNAELGTAPSSAVLFSPSALSSKTANTVAPLDAGATGVCITINTYSTGATLIARIITPSNSDRG